MDVVLFHLKDAWPSILYPTVKAQAAELKPNRTSLLRHELRCCIACIPQTYTPSF